MQKCNIMLFAAGLGTRLRPATLQHPKPCIPMLSIPMGYYLFPYLKALNVSQIIINTFHLPEQIHDLYQKINMNISFSDEKDFIKGSGGGLKQAEKLFANNSDPVLVCNSDEVLFTTENNFLKNAFEKHQTQNYFATLIVMKHPLAGTQFGAIWADSSGRVVHIGKEAPTEKATPWHFIGLQFLERDIFQMIKADQESNIFYDVLIHHLKEKKVQIYSIQAEWYETGNLADYTEAKKNIQNKLKDQAHYQNQFNELNLLPRSQISDLA
jgi:mannose-1-phosphate guanylyltransferase